MMLENVEEGFDPFISMPGIPLTSNVAFQIDFAVKLFNPVFTNLSSPLLKDAQLDLSFWFTQLNDKLLLEDKEAFTPATYFVNEID
ncbi:MAG: hypothetical protein RLZZ330_934 [Actinomycetota bacterium]